MKNILARSSNWNILGESWNEYLFIELHLCFAYGMFIHLGMIRASKVFLTSMKVSFFKIPRNEFEDHLVMLDCLLFTDVLFRLACICWKCCEELPWRCSISCGAMRNCVVVIVCKNGIRSDIAFLYIVHDFVLFW